MRGRFTKKNSLYFRDVLIGATDEILCELKNEKTKDKGTIFFLCQTVYKIFILEKRAVVESMLGTLQDSSYYFLCNLSKKITDYQTQSAVAEPEDVGDIDEYGVNVEFDESGSEDEERNYIRDSSSSEDEGMDF